MIFRYKEKVGHLTRIEGLHYRFEWDGLKTKILFSSEKEMMAFCENTAAIRRVVQELKEEGKH